MTEQQMRDRKLVTEMWYLLRDFGDLTNDHTQTDRWEEYIDRSEAIRKQFPEARRLFIDLDIMLEIRSRKAC